MATRGKPRQGRYYRNKASACSWRVLHDPLDIGGFDPGARFSDYEVAKMLTYCSFTKGTTLKRSTNGNSHARFTVMGGEEHQRLKGKRHNITVEYGDKLIHGMPKVGE